MKVIFVAGKPVTIHPIARAAITELSRWAIGYAAKWGGMVTVPRDDFLALLDQAARACPEEQPNATTLTHEEVLVALNHQPEEIP